MSKKNEESKLHDRLVSLYLKRNKLDEQGNKTELKTVDEEIDKLISKLAGLKMVKSQMRTS